MLPSWFVLAQQQIGVREVPGPASHPQIVAYHQSTNLARVAAGKDESPWCSSFVNWTLEQSGYVGTDSALARSWLKWGMELPEPWVGAVTIIKRKETGPDGATGSASGYHVAFLAPGSHSGSVRLLGGNQSDQVKYSLFALSRYDVLGYHWPIVRAA
jgi:uncharacterized protein (TIGR02594 family)